MDDETTTERPTHLIVPTNDPGACELEHTAQGWIVANLYVGRFFPGKCEGKLYALEFWRPKPVLKQGELL